MSTDEFVQNWTTADWCASVPNRSCPGYRRFVALREEVPPPPDAWVRPARTLAGRVALVSFFVDRPDSSWADEEVCEILRTAEKCANWLTKQASRYGAELSVRCETLYYHTSDLREDLVPIAFRTEAGATVPIEAQSAAGTMAFASYWPRQLGFADIVRFFGHVQRSVDADSWVVLFHPREAGRSFALPAHFSLHPCVQLAVCYAQDAALRGDVYGRLRPNPAVYAHELLHLFGATDKYDVIAVEDFPSESVTEQDIMRSGRMRLEQTRIDSLTAAEIGWPISQW